MRKPYVKFLQISLLAGLLLVIGIFNYPSKASAADIVGMNHNERLAIVSQIEPAFGGMFLDTDNPTHLNIFIHRANFKSTQQVQTELESAYSAVTSVFGDAGYTPDSSSALHARFQMGDLAYWYGLLIEDRRVFSIEGVASGDLSEHLNRIQIGVTDGVPGLIARLKVRDMLRDLGIPQLAVRLRLAQNFTSDKLLSEFERPLEGGWQVRTKKSGVEMAPCSIGFIADLAGVRGFVTASHCTSTMWGIDSSTTYHQPSAALGPTTLGVELEDPPSFTCLVEGVNRPCRRSDASFIRLNGGITNEKGLIARTTTIGGAPERNDSNPNFYISIKDTNPPYVGLPVHKVGRTSGWTTGNVTESCVTIKSTHSVLGTIGYFCHAKANYFASSGDSGAPVFWMVNPSLPNQQEVALIGTHVASSSPFVGGPVTSAFSTLNRIMEELGGVPQNWSVCTQSVC